MGPVFDAHREPRLTLADLRKEQQRLNDDARMMQPVSSIEVRCLREDIEISDIQWKDEEKQRSFFARQGRKEKTHIARQILLQALLEESLSVGNLLDDPFAELTICDATIPIIDDGA